MESHRAGIHRIVAGEGAVIAQEELPDGITGRLRPAPMTAASRSGLAPWTVKLASGAPTKLAVMERAGSAKSWLHPARSCSPRGWARPTGRSPVNSRPSRLRAEAVVSSATWRSIAPAPDSVKAFWPMTIPQNSRFSSRLIHCVIKDIIIHSLTREFPGLAGARERLRGVE